MRPITQMCHPIIMNNLSIGSTNSNNNNNSNNTSFIATTLNETSSSSATKTANLFRSRSLRESITRV